MVLMLSKLLLITEGPAFSAKSEAPYSLCEIVSKRMGKEPKRHIPERERPGEMAALGNIRL